MKVSVNANKYNSMMLTLVRSYGREDWLMEASDLHDATGEPTAEIIKGFILPTVKSWYASEEALKSVPFDTVLSKVFVEFSNMVLS